MADALEYVVAAVIDQMRKNSNYEIDSFSALKEAIARPYGVVISDDHVEVLARRLEQLGILKRVSDQYAGVYFVPISGLNLLLKVSQLQSNSPDSRIVQALSGGRALFKRVFKSDQFWKDFSAQIDDQQAAIGSISIVDVAEAEVIPASDRIVTLSHNQQLELDEASTELIDGLSKENSVDGDADLKDRLLGQIRAARELIRATSVRAYLLYETAFAILGGLIERYKGQAIGHAAKKLLDLLIENVFK